MNTTTAIVNSTIANNTDSTGGGGTGVITWAGANLNVVNSTIAYNTGSGVGGNGIYNYGTAKLKNTLLAHNPGDCRTDVNSGFTAGTMTDGGYNLEDENSCGFASASLTSTDPLLVGTSPASNGGGTDTFALQSGSPAIGAASCADISGHQVSTDQRGTYRPLFACSIGAYEADQSNDTWANAIPLGNTFENQTAYQVGQTMHQYIYASNQARWYTFSVTPGSLVHISYQGDPGAVVSLHSDVQAAYKSLATPANAAVQSALNSSSGFLPQSFLPQSFLPQSFLPQSFLPQSFLPQSFLPQSFLPQSFLPQSFLPQSFLPQSFLPQSFLPQSFLPGAYSGAVETSLLTLSATPNSTTQTIDHYTWNATGTFYVRVAGPINRNSSFMLTVTETSGVCSGGSAISSIPATPPTSIPSGLASLILWDSSRIAGSPSDVSTLSSKLNTFAGRSDVHGAVIDLSGNPGVESAQAQSDNHPGCPAAKNIVAGDVKSVIQAYRAQNPTLKYIVLVGDDRSIPYFRLPDEAGLGPENQYYPPVADTSASNASLRNNYVLNQDEYGASTDLPISDFALPIPDVAVGRVVSTATEVSHMLDVYTSANGTLTPSSALVTGYDFVSDAACTAQSDLVAGMPSTARADTLIQQGTQTLPTSCPLTSAAWTANNLRQKLLGSRHDIVFMAGHFSAGGVEAGDYASSLGSADVASSTVDMTNSLVLALGCHGGYNIPGGDAVANYSPSPDWPEAFAQKGATLLAATGYAYGDTDLTEYGEHLFTNFVKQLRSYAGSSYAPVAVGQAEIAAKKEYLATHTNLSGADEKTLLETALYGLPMMLVNMTGQHINTQPDSSIVASAPTVTSGPGTNFNLAQGQNTSGSSDIDVQPSLTTNTQTLSNGTSGSVSATSLSGPSGVVARPGEPILPAAVYNVHVPSQILRGVGFRGGTYTDQSPITPLTSAAGTETSVGHPAFYSSVFYPTQVWTPNYFDAIGGGAEHLATTPAQYISASPSSTSGTLRKFSDLKFRLFYLPSNWTGNATTAAAAVAAAPNISSVSATTDSSGNVTFNVHVLSDQSAGTQGVWITYTNPGSPGTWQSIDLSQSSSDPTLWTATQSLPSGIVFMVQAVNGTGLVTLANNAGAYYSVGSATPPTLQPTTVSLVSPPTSGTFQTSTTFNVQLQSGSTNLSGQLVTVQVGSQQGFGTTDGSGTATVTVPLSQPPGFYSAVATFGGGAGYLASSSSSSGFTINAAPTSLSLATQPSDYSDQTAVTATLTDSGGSPLVQRTILFTVTGNGTTYNRTGITDGNGRAQLGSLPLPAGTYSVTAAFGGANNPITVTVGGSTVTESDPDYQTSNAGPASFTVKQVPASVSIGPSDANLVKVSSTGGTATVPLTAILSAGKGDLTTASLTFTLTSLTASGTTYSCTVSKSGGTLTATAGSGACSSPTLSGTGSPLTWGATFTGVAPGVYKLTFSVGGNYTVGSAQTGVVTVYDPSLSYTVGGGTFTRGETSGNVPIMFGFYAKNVSGKIQGAWLSVEHRSSGDVVLQSSSLSSLSIVPGTGTQETAFLQGSATNQGTAGYAFLAKGIDANSTGPSSNPDQYGQQLKSSSGALISDLSYNALALTGGDIVVP